MPEILARLMQKTECVTKEELIKFMYNAQDSVMKRISGNIREMIEDVSKSNYMPLALSTILEAQQIDSHWISHGKSKFGDGLTKCLNNCPMQWRLFDLLIESLNCESLCEDVKKERKRKIEEAVRAISENL